MNEFEIIGYEEISQNDITQEGKLNKEEIVNRILYRLFNKQDWKLIRKKDL